MIDMCGGHSRTLVVIRHLIDPRFNKILVWVSVLGRCISKIGARAEIIRIVWDAESAGNSLRNISFQSAKLNTAHPFHNWWHSVYCRLEQDLKS